MSPQNKIIFASLAAVAGATVFLALVLTAITPYHWLAIWFFVIVILSVTGAVAASVALAPHASQALTISMNAFKAKCPDCGSVRIEMTASTTTGSVRCAGLVTRKSASGFLGLTTRGGGLGGVGGSSWQERVPVIRTTYLQKWRCGDCRCVWSKEVAEEVEDFGR